MLKANNHLQRAPDAVFRIWHFREKIEVEAAHAFKFLGDHLAHLWGSKDSIALLAYQAYDDEMRHKKMCRAILEHAPHAYAAVPEQVNIALGPASLTLRERALYGAVAMGCITESLSSALLLEMQRRAEHVLIKETVHAILRDEITHARIGWAELARAHQSMDVSFLAAYLDRMIAVAMASDIQPMINSTNDDHDLSAWGILSRADAQRIMADTIACVIVPGLKQYGIAVNSHEFIKNSDVADTNMAE